MTSGEPTNNDVAYAGIRRKVPDALRSQIDAVEYNCVVLLFADIGFKGDYADARGGLGRRCARCCRLVGKFAQSKRFVEVHAWQQPDISIFGHELSPTRSWLVHMNLASLVIDDNSASRSHSASGGRMPLADFAKGEYPEWR